MAFHTATKIKAFYLYAHMADVFSFFKWKNLIAEMCVYKKAIHNYLHTPNS